MMAAPAAEEMARDGTINGRKVRLLISDLDGTLVRSDKSLSVRTIAAIARVREAGIAVSLISARPLSGVIDIARKLELAGPFGAFNGGTIFCADGRVSNVEQLPEGRGGEIVSMIEEAGIVPWLFADGLWFAPDDRNEHVPSERKTAAMEPTLRPDLAQFAGAVDKVVAVSDDDCVLSRLEDCARERFGDHAAIKRSQPYYLDFTAPRANKGAGVARLAAAYGVPLDRTLVIGDGLNDIAMFECAGASIAMANATDEVRTAATRVTESNDEDGVAQAIDLLLQEIAS